VSDERPWEDYANPVGQRFNAAEPTAFGQRFGAVDAPAPDEPVGYGEDIGKSFVGGVGRGVAGTIGAPGMIGGLVRTGLSNLGVSDENIDRAANVIGTALPATRVFRGPDAGQVQKAVESYTGPFYQPQTLPGKYASTVGEFAPAALIPGGGVGARIVNTVVPALASEAAGQLTEGTPAEPYARFVAGMAAGPAVGKLITPAGPASAARQDAVAALEREGIPVTAGQRTGSKPIQYMESNAADMPFSAGRAAEMNAAQAAAVDRAFTNRAFDPAELQARGLPPEASLPRPDVMAAGRQSLSDRYTQLSQANALRSDPQLQSDLLAAQTAYERNVLPSQRTRDVEAMRNDIVDRLIAGQGQMPGGVYQATRSQLGTNAQGVANTQPYLANALRDMRGALDRGMQRGLTPQDAARWADTNRRWGNMRQLEGAVATAGENLSPAKVAQSVRSGRVSQAARGAGDMDELARAAALVIKPPPNSGTAARLGMQKLFNIPSWLAAGATTGTAGFGAAGPIGAALGAAAPFVASRLALSRPGQAYLGNQLMAQNVRDILAQGLMQRAISQPRGVPHNQAERDDDEKRRIADRRNPGQQEQP
jgi:hypothetical protein